MVIDRRQGRYRVRIFHKGRYVRSATFRTKRETESFERAQYSALAAGTWVDTSKAGTVEEHARLWLASKQSGKQSSIADREKVVRQYVLPAFGRLPLTSVAPSEVESWAVKLATSKSPSTARRAHGALRSIFNVALRDGLISRNPALGIKLPTAQPNEPRPLTHEQLRKLIDAADSVRDRLMIAVAGYTGLRWGELTALRVQSVRLDGSIRVTEAWSEVSGKMYLGSTKTHSARTVVPPKSVSRELLDFMKNKSASELLFSAKSSPETPLRNSNWTPRNLHRCCDRAGIQRITPHNLRDTAASLAIHFGASVVTVSQMLGHRDAATTLKHYAAFSPSDVSLIADRLEQKITELNDSN